MLSGNWNQQFYCWLCGSSQKSETNRLGGHRWKCQDMSVELASDLGRRPHTSPRASLMFSPWKPDVYLWTVQAPKSCCSIVCTIDLREKSSGHSTLDWHPDQRRRPLYGYHKINATLSTTSDPLPNLLIPIGPISTCSPVVVSPPIGRRCVTYFITTDYRYKDRLLRSPDQ